MKRYIYKGVRYWFVPEEAPEGAEEICKPKARSTRNKAKSTSNKSRSTKAK